MLSKENRVRLRLFGDHLVARARRNQADTKAIRRRKLIVPVAGLPARGATGRLFFLASAVEIIGMVVHDEIPEAACRTQQEAFTASASLGTTSLPRLYVDSRNSLQGVGGRVFE